MVPRNTFLVISSMRMRNLSNIKGRWTLTEHFENKADQVFKRKISSETFQSNIRWPSVRTNFSNMRIIFFSLVATFWFLVCTSNMGNNFINHESRQSSSEYLIFLLQAHSNYTDKSSEDVFSSLSEGIDSEPKRIKLMNVTKVRNKISLICSKFMNTSALSGEL